MSRSAYPLHDPGGMERAVYLQAKHLQARGVDTVLVTRPATRDGALFPGELVTVPYGSRRAGAHGRILDRTVHYPAFSARVGEAVARLVRDRTIDIVDAQGLTALGYGRLRAGDRELRAPLVMNPQGMEEHKAGGLKRLALTRLRALSQEAARLADRVVATDDATRDEVPRLLGVPAEKVVVLPNGIDPDEIALLTPADPARVAADLITQAEHGIDSPAILVTTDARFADAVEAEVARQLGGAPRRSILERALADHGAVVLAPDLDAAVRFVNAYGPEHLSVDVEPLEPTVARIRNAGSLFVGPWAPESAGDYATGANHVLPTGGLARACGPLSVEAFGKFVQVQRVSRDGLASIRATIGTLAQVEGLLAHREAVEIRFRQERGSAEDRE